MRSYAILVLLKNKRRGKIVGARKDHITGMERAQIAMQVLAPKRDFGVVTKLAQEKGVSRQTLYAIAAAGKRVLQAGLEPGAHGPRPKEKVIRVDRNRLARSAVVLTEVGVSQRDIGLCLAEMLDSRLSPGWVNAELAQRETRAAVVNARWQPLAQESLSGDEIYSHGSPNLLVVGNQSLYIYALTRQPTCDGDTWGCVLLDTSGGTQFASDAGKGLALGALEAGVVVHQLDWDHLLRPVWGQAARLERQAYAALEAVEERAAQFDQTQTTRRLEQHLQVWERQQAEAEQKVSRCDAFAEIAHQVDEEFGLIDQETGGLREAQAAAENLRRLGKRLSQWEGRIYRKLSSNLIHWAEGLFAYQSGLNHQLLPLQERFGTQALQALLRLWQLEADGKRRALPWKEQQARQVFWEKNLDRAIACLGEDTFWQAWQAIDSLLGQPWRGSMLAECVNSLLRPVLAARKQSDQGCLELFRFLHNSRPFARGKRAGFSPAELVGLDVPADPLTLLGLAPKCQSNFL
jgi:hypothetical protein